MFALITPLSWNRTQREVFRYFRRQSVSASIEGEPETLSRNRDRQVTRRRSGWLVGPGSRLAIRAVFTPVLTKYSESFSLAAD